jgi:glycine oxidase
VTWDVIISGAGIIGISLALELQKQGVKALVLERGEPGREASSAAAGMLAPADPETPIALRQIAYESARLFPEYVKQLETASGINADFRQNGTIAFLESAETPNAYKKLSAEDALRLEPSLKAIQHHAFFVQEDSVDPRLLMQAALAAARKLGIKIREATPVWKVHALGQDVEVVADKERFIAHKVVNCQGAWSGAPVRPRKGQMLYVEPANAIELKHVVRTPEVYIVPRSSGKILIGATVEDVGYDKTVEKDAIQKLLNAAAKYLPGIESAQILESWAGLRPGTLDDLPILGPTEIHGVFIASGHFRNGILLAPVTAKIMASVIMGKPAPLDISAFSPARWQQEGQVNHAISVKE